MKKSLLEKMMLYTGCFCIESLLALIPLILAIGLFIDAQMSDIIAFMTGVILFIVVSTIFFWKYTVKYKEAFFNTLKSKNKGSVGCDDPDIIPAPKATSHCPFYKKYSQFPKLKARSPMEFDIRFIYLCPDSITFFTDCAKYHIFKDNVKVEKKGFRKIKKPKDSCGKIYELYYYNIMYITYENEEITFYLTDGSKWGFPADKTKQKDIIKKMRTRLRKVIQRKTIHKYEKPFVVSVRKHQEKDS